MAKGTIAGSATADVLVAADEHRGEITLQHTSGSPVFLSFGDDVPVVDEGLILSATFPVITVSDHRANLAINGICDTALTAAGTYADDRS